MNYKTIIVSDLHLGSPDAKHKELDKFLNKNKCENLILNGDIIDTWHLKIFGGRKPAYEVFLQNIQNICKQNNTQLYYLKGNHEEFLEEINSIKDIQILKDMIYKTNGKKYYICHGHQFDKVEDHLEGWTYISFILGALVYRTNRRFNKLTSLLDLPYLSLVKKIKRIVKTAMVGGKKTFENKLINKAKQKNVDGIILGHLHKPENKQIGDLHYLNSGDWIELCTAIVEDFDGNFQIIKYKG